MTPSGVAADRALADHAADPHRPVGGGTAVPHDVAGRIEEGRLGAQRRHGEQHGAAHRAEREQDQNEALVLGLHGRSLKARRLGLGPPHRRPAPQGQAEHRHDVSA